ncbi:hypothetical protein [Ulvibacterium marinum]|uniref:hypothetical protein n=1 Tax=Ulvibacterium marinum TaxID=2419782 RepID=UPI0024956135|nr:hypothetical protein [Ulvibacterium marinum]
MKINRDRIFGSLILTSLLFISGCKQTAKIHDPDKELISWIVDEIAFPLPPPPPIESKDAIILKRIVDSLLSIKLIVAVYPVMDATIENSELKNIPNGFQELIDTIPDTKYITTTEGIKSQKGHTIVLPDTTKMKDSYDFNDFDLLFNFSKIWYNRGGTRAIFEVGVSRSGLAGGAAIFCLEKVKGKWQVVELVPTTIW